MAKNVIINGVTYNDVPYVNIPLAAGGGNAKFVDTDSGDALASDIRSGKKVWVDGNEITGTVQGKDANNVTVSGKTVTIPSGIYDSQVQKSIADGSVTPNVTVSGGEIGDVVSDYPVTITPKATVGSVGYISTIADGSLVTKYIQVQEKTVSPSSSTQTVNPDSGKLLKQVTVNAVTLSGTANPSDVLYGKTFYKDSLTQLTGTASVPVVGQDSTTKVLTIQ